MNTAARPNFIFILADGLGYADLGCYGGRELCSLNLDRMATEGLRFTDGHANSSVCSPTRFALATGRWQHRLRGSADESLGSAAAKFGLPPEYPTVASIWSEAGYAAGLAGKWHMGVLPRFGPLKNGYDEFFGFMDAPSITPIIARGGGMTFTTARRRFVGMAT